MLLKLPWAIAAVTAALAALMVSRLWLVEGLLRRVTIDGPSMAPAFCGLHYDLTCGDCKFPFQIDAEHPPKGGLAACPNCGFGDNQLAQAQLRPAERVLVDRWPLVWRQPKRGEVVAARDPLSGKDLIVKRVAAIASEQLAIEGGDLHLGDKLQHKTLAKLEEMRVLVHDNNYQPRSSSDLPPRWRGAKPNSTWRPNGSGFRIAQSNKQDGDIDWLEYQHWPCTADPRLRGVPAPIRDHDSYNQGPGTRELNTVRDVILTCELQASGAGRLAFAATDGNERMTVTVELEESRVIIQIGNREPTVQPLKTRVFRNGARVDFGLCDQQLLMAVNGQMLVRVSYERSAETSAETLHPLVIGVCGLAVKIEHLRVWRDIYYLDPQGLSRPWRSAAPLGSGHVALLGDNQPVSTDSRHWESTGVSRSSILGRVHRPFWATY